MLDRSKTKSDALDEWARAVMIREYSYGVISGVLLCGLAYLLFKPSTPPPPPGTVVTAAPAKEVERVVWKKADCPGILVAPAAVREKLGVPETAGAVVAAARVAPDDHPHTITATYSPDTLRVALHDRRDPIPWFSVGSHGSLGMAYGVNDAGGGAYRVTAGYIPVLFKNMSLGVLGSVETGGRWFAGISGIVTFRLP